MRKFSVNLHFDVVVPVEVEAINEEDAKIIAEEIDFDPKSKFEVFDACSCVTDVEERPGDYDDTISELIGECIDYESGTFSTDEIETAAREVVEFGSNIYEQYTKEDVVLDILAEAGWNREKE